MSAFHAQVEALVAFRDALGRHRGQAAEVMDGAESRVRRAQVELDEIEHAWRREVERRHAAAEDCHRQALAAAHEGMGYVDCSPQQQALQRAEEALAQVLRARREVEQAIDRYHHEGQAYGQFMDDDFSRGQHYLDRCIDHFLRFGAERIAIPYLEWLAPRGIPRPPSPPPSADRVVGTPEQRKEAEPRDSAPEARG